MLTWEIMFSLFKNPNRVLTVQWSLQDSIPFTVLGFWIKLIYIPGKMQVKMQVKISLQFTYFGSVRYKWSFRQLSVSFRSEYFNTFFIYLQTACNLAFLSLLPFFIYSVYLLSAKKIIIFFYHFFCFAGTFDL